jgi:glycosyltransferase involved in cell wall biosynthesis
MRRLAVLTSHPIQYYAPLFRELTKIVDLHVFFAHRATPEQQAAAGFGSAFDWDVDLTSGYAHSFLQNVARDPSAARFSGCDTPEIGARLAEGRFDAVLTLGWHLKSLVQGTLAAKRQGLPVMVRGDSQLDGRRSLLKRAAKAVCYPPLLRLFDAALYVGERNRAYYRRYGYPESRLFFSPHCVDTGWFAARAMPEARQRLRGALGLGEDDRAVLFAGKLVAFKRPLDVVESCALLRGAGAPVHLVVAGSGALEQQMRERAATLDLPAHFLGFRNQTEMPETYAAADVLVLPSDGRETWGLVVNEALACGTPVVVSDKVGCAPDLAANGGGLTFPVGDVAALSRSVQQLVAEPERARAAVETSAAYSLPAAATGVMTALATLAED